MSVDPSLTHTGVVFGTIERDSLYISHYDLCITEKSTNKKVRASSDLVSRCRQIINNITKWIEEYQPDIIFAETPSGSKNASAARSYGISCFAIALLEPPAIQVTPQEVKKLVFGKSTATKKEIIEYVDKKYDYFELPMYDGRINLGKAEHIADAVCIAEAGLQTNQFQQLKQIIG